MHTVFIRIGSLLIPSYGVLAAAGVLVALALVLNTARTARLDPNRMWTLSILSLFVALAGSRLLLIALNWTLIRTHPRWLLDVAIIHSPLLASIGALLFSATALAYARTRQLPLRSVADALAAPIATGLAFEQLGALLSGSGFGIESSLPWAVTYTDPLAARWSGTPLFVPLHPVQAYAGLAFAVIGAVLFLGMKHRRQQGDLAGLALLLLGVAVFFTEFLRDPEGRGTLLHGALLLPQLGAVALVLLGALLLREQPSAQLAETEATHA